MMLIGVHLYLTFHCTTLKVKTFISALKSRIIPEYPAYPTPSTSNFKSFSGPFVSGHYTASTTQRPICPTVLHDNVLLKDPICAARFLVGRSSSRQLLRIHVYRTKFAFEKADRMVRTKEEIESKSE